MKIVFLSAFYPFRGGISQFSGLIFRELEKKVSVIPLTFKRQYPNFLFPGKTQLVTTEDKADKIPAEQCLDSINPISYISTALKIRKVTPEVLITRYWMSFFSPALSVILRLQKKRTLKIALVDNAIPHEKRFFDSFLTRLYVNSNDAFIVMSDQVKNDILYFRKDAKILQLPHPVYNQFGARLERKDALKNLNLEHLNEKKILLFFGLIRDYKGLDLLINALSELPSDFYLIIAGECYGSFEKYEIQISSLGLSKRVTVFNQYIPDDEVTNFFSVAEMCMLTYHSATQSGITNIAYHFEIPVVVTPVGGLAENVTEGKTGGVAHGNPKEIAEKVKELSHLKQTVDFALHIRELNRQNDWAAFTEKSLQFIKDLKAV